METWTILVIIVGSFALLFMLKTFVKPEPLPDKPLFICTQCLTVGNKESTIKGHWLIQSILYGFGVLPGVAYSSWRHSTIKDVCPQCKNEAMIPLDTPRGKKLLIESGHEINK